MVVWSGGQTGVDRAALDAALMAGLAVGGWCPRGRRAEDGPIPLRYPLRETPTSDYAERTRLNVRDTDATLILAYGPLGGGTALTARLARDAGKPLKIADLTGEASPAATLDWIRGEGVGVLNVAGPRASEGPGVYGEARRLLNEVFGRLRRPA